MLKRITEEDIEGSLPGDAYCYMDLDNLDLDQSAISCGYCEYVANSLKDAYKHYKEEHKNVYDDRIKKLTAERKSGNKIIKKKLLFNDKPEEERHMYTQSATNKKICVIDFDIRITKEEVEEEMTKDVKMELDISNDITEETLKELNDLLKKHLNYLKYKNKKSTGEQNYSQNVSDPKLPNVIKKLFSEGAEKVIISENKNGNYTVGYKVKDINKLSKIDHKDDDKDGTFKIDL